MTSAIAYTCNRCGTTTMTPISKAKPSWVFVDISQYQGGSGPARTYAHVCPECWPAVRQAINSREP
jgi:hypothetical protein